MPIRILVVDDNSDTLRAYIKALHRGIKQGGVTNGLSRRETELPLKVESANTISVALNKIRTQPFEILVVDLKIPGLSGEEMGGLEFISEAIKLDPLRPIIAITGYGSIGLARKTLTQGVFDFIEKSATATDDLINAVERALCLHDEKIKRTGGNPFTPMSGVEPTVFGGRTKELNFFEQRLNRALHSRFREHFLVLGNWGIGKSTLFKEYKRICQSRGHIAALVPLEHLQSGTTVNEAARSIIEGILRILPYPIDHFKKVINFFDSIGANIIGTGIQIGLKDPSKQKLPAQAFLHDALLSLWKDLKDKTEVLLILLDDLDNFMTVPEILTTLKQTLSMDSIMMSKILVGIASTKAAWLDLTVTKKHHPLSRYFISQVELSPLSKDEVEETIFKSLIGSGVSFSSEVIDLVFAYTQGHPFEMQVLCHHLFDNQLYRKADIDTWEKALQSAIDNMGNAVFDYWYSQASGEEAKILRVIADTEKCMSIKEIQKIIDLNKIEVSSRNIAKYLQRLVEKKLIIKSSRGSYTILDKMFCTYIQTRTNL